MFLLLLLSIGLCFLWLLYKGGVYALPCVIGWGAGRVAYETGALWTGAAIVGIGAALAFFAFARAAFAGASSALVRWMLAAVFVAPSLMVSYNMAIDLLQSAVPSVVWRGIIAPALATLIGAVAFVRLSEEAVAD